MADAETLPSPESEAKSKPALEPAPTPAWVKIGGGVLGAIIIGLQSFNLHQVGIGNDNGLVRTSMLERLLDISTKIDESLRNQTVLLQNQTVMLQSDNRMLQDDTILIQKQTEILTTITKAIEDRKELLDQDLKDLRARQEADAQELRERQDRQGERQDRQGYRQDYQDEVERANPSPSPRPSPRPSVSPLPP
jgi:hypothetical protein